MRARHNGEQPEANSSASPLPKLAFLAAFLMLVFLNSARAEENKFFRTATFEQGMHQVSLNCFGCSVVVKGDLDGEIITIGGDVTVFGTVHRDIIAVGGAIHLKNGAAVDRDVIAIGGDITTEGSVTAPRKISFVAVPWMHLPGQLNIGWRGAVALLGFHAVCVLLPVLLLRAWRVRNVAAASRRWVVTGLTGVVAIVAISLLLNVLDEELNAGDTAELGVSILFLAVLAAGISGIALAIGERFFPRRIVAALLTGGILLVVFELVPWLGFAVMVLGSCWATGAALWSGIGFRGPQSPTPRRAPATLKLTS